LIAGIFSTIAAIVTLFIGGVGSAVHAEKASTVVALGWGGVAFSFLTIILGGIAISANSKLPGILLIVSAILGAILGGTFVAVFMVLALAGGVLAIIGTKSAAPPPLGAYDPHH
jgi:hypothetical protein